MGVPPLVGPLRTGPPASPATQQTTPGGSDGAVHWSLSAKGSYATDRPDKSAAHLQCCYPALANSKSSIFGRADVRPGNLDNLASRGVIRFLRELSILDEL